MNKLRTKKEEAKPNQQNQDLAETMIERDLIEKMVVRPMKKEVKTLKQS